MQNAKLTAQQLDALRDEIDAIRLEHRATLGERDARYIRRIMRTARGLSIAGRTLLMFSFNPITWVLGTVSLGVSKILENMEVGHNVIHGQYDWMNDPRVDSSRYEWDNVCAAADWHHSHNVMHHNYTNIVGKDPDFGYGVLRMAEQMPWQRRHRGQLGVSAVTAIMFEWGVGIHDADPGAVRDGKQSVKEFASKLQLFGRKAVRQGVKDYALFPALALLTGNALGVLAGNAIANLMRNIWAAIIIFCGHFPEKVRVFSADEAANESRGAWYARQIEGSCNISGGKLLYLMSGHLSHQIEHHLFPDIPSHRYPEIAPRIQDICRRYGLRYTTGNLVAQSFSVLKRIARFSAPPKAPSEPPMPLTA